MKIRILPQTKLGTWSVWLIAGLFILIAIGSFSVNFYREAPPSATMWEDVLNRPAVALAMYAGFLSGMAACITGLIALFKKDRAVFTFISTAIGFILILFLFAEIAFPH